MTNAILKVEPTLLEWNARFATKKTEEKNPTKTETRLFYDIGTLQASVIKFAKISYKVHEYNK